MSVTLQKLMKTNFPSTSSFTPAQTGLLQRKCDGEQCDERKRLDLQRSSLSHDELYIVPPIVHEVLRSIMEPRFGHDFSKLRVHSTGPGMIQTKLTINKSGNPYEQEADRVTKQVMRLEDPKVQRQPKEELIKKKNCDYSINSETV